MSTHVSKRSRKPVKEVDLRILQICKIGILLDFSLMLNTRWSSINLFLLMLELGVCSGLNVHAQKGLEVITEAEND